MAIRLNQNNVLWTPSAQADRVPHLVEYTTYVETRIGRQFATYDELWDWSVSDLGAFWDSVWDYFGVRGTRPSSEVLLSEKMPGTTWFPGSTLNYAENALAHDLETPALVSLKEGKEPVETSWSELRGQVGAFSSWLTSQGVRRGDRVVGYLPAITESVVAFLACASIGAIWGSCSQEFSPQGAAERFGQLEPKILIIADGYQYAGKIHSRKDQAAELRQLLPTVEQVVSISNIGDDTARLADSHPFEELLRNAQEPTFAQVPFDHPLWVLFSSATTGPPKGIVHGHGGIVLEQLKYLGLHLDIGPENKYFWFTTTSWVMWNLQVAGLLRGATIYLFDGSPTWPDERTLWRLVSDHEINFFGASAAFLIATKKRGIELSTEYNLSSMTGLGSTGSPLPSTTAEWIYSKLEHVWLCTVSGGTDIASAFCGGVPTLPVRSAEMQARLLGVDMRSWDDSQRDLIDDVGELVVTRPMPSMPIRFWNDPHGQRLNDAYFNTFPGVWRHGDWVTVTSTGGVVIHGRSDATINRYGVRMGSAEIYEAVDHINGVNDSLVVGVEEGDGGYWMPLFVVAPDVEDFAALASSIESAIRSTVSPRHVPDDIIAVASLPRTLTGKRLEIPVKRIIQGIPVHVAANPASVTNPESLDWFANLPRARRARLGARRKASAQTPNTAETTH